MDKQMEFQMLQQQMQKHQTDMQHFQRQKLEVEHLVETIKNLNKGEKVFTPIGAGIYYNAKITDNLKFMVNVGSGNFVEKTKSGVKLGYGDLNEFNKCILELEKNPELCQKMGKNGRAFIEENLTFEKIGNRLDKIIK